MQKEKVPMPLQDPIERRSNFSEVSLGYTPEMAMQEASRCLNCKHRPCVGGCPVKVDIPDFIMLVSEGKFEEAYEVLSRQTCLPAVCGRVCPQESQCEKVCVRGIKNEPVGIGRLERFVADWYRENVGKRPEAPLSNGKRVAVVGAGPAGLAAANELAKRGYEVTMFEALHKTGGVLAYGIPEFRLPKSIVNYEIENLKNMSVDIDTNMVVGRSVTIDDLFGIGFEAVFIGSGAGLPRFMNIPGENLNGVQSANELLARVNLMQAWQDDTKTPIVHAKHVAVIGGGNVAMDAARSAKRLGAKEVSIIYRRGKDEMPARREEIEHAEEEGIQFHTLTNPRRIVGDEQGQCVGVECVRCELGEPDESGRRRPIEIEGSEYIIVADSVIMSIGTSPNPLISRTTPGLETNRWGCLVTKDDSGLTTRENVYSGGDAVTGAATVILAMGAGKDAAIAIDEKLSDKE